MPEVNTERGSVLSVIHKPKNCLLLVAFPLTEEEFLNDLRPESPKDYAKMTASKFKFLPHFLWMHNHLPLVKTIKDCAGTVSPLGVTVKLQATPSDLNDISGYSVVTLVAHFNNKQQEVEFSDKLYSIDEVAGMADENFRGVFDLSVCNSKFLQDKLKDKYGDRCFVKANIDLAEIKIHLILYKNVIEMLSKFETNYLTAMLNLKRQLNSYANNKM